eukprot:c9205_g1_i1 orf=1-270(-)
MMASCGISSQCSRDSLISRYIKSGKSQHALYLYQKLQKDCPQFDGRTFVPLLKACTKLNDVETGRKLHAVISSKGLDKDAYIGSILVDMY